MLERACGLRYRRAVLYVSRSNDLAQLTDQLARVLSEPGLTPLESDVILIQSAGIQRWLSRELSRRLGVLAGARFPFPRAYIHEVLDLALGPSEGAAHYEREALTWTIFGAIEKFLSHEAFSFVRVFLEGDVDDTQRFFLAERLANLFDQYVIYRPQLLKGWERGEEPADFQAVLWRSLRAQLGPHHFAERVRQLFEEVSDAELGALLPARISLMGGPGLPPLFLKVLARLSRACDVHILSFSVSEEYFAEAHPLNEELPETGDGLHPLLIELGKVGADYQKILEPYTYVDHSVDYRRPDGDTVLHHLQRDLLESRVRPRDELLSVAQLGDRSLTLDACHSPLREVEALYDRLLGFFAEDPSLKAEDVVVLTPDIEAYSPLISAVFGARSGDKLIPFRVADRNERAENPAAAAFLLALTTLTGRLSASEVLDLLQCEPVQARFGLDAVALERVRGWVSDVGIRWGADAEHRAEFGIEGDLNTWRHGLDRLLLGYVMADEDQAWFHDSVPHDDVAPGDGEVLSSLARYVETLLTFRRLCGASRPGARQNWKTPAEWCELLRSFAPQLLAAASDSWSIEIVFDALTLLEERARLGGAAAPVALPLMVHLLEKELEGRRPSTDFLAGGLTFCELLPLRTIPFRIICVLGLNQGDFPRVDRALSYDKLLVRPERGDRSIRADDRYLFLEMLTAARDKVSLSYVGRSIQDNTLKPPSVVVSELSSVLSGMFARTDEDPRYLAPAEHPLQPFSPRYFDGSDSKLASSSTEWRKAAETLRGGAKEPRQFVPRDFVLPFVQPSQLDIRTLIDFLGRPVRSFLRRLELTIDDSVELVEDREPIVLDQLSKFKRGTDAMRRLSSGEVPLSELDLRRGQYPAGTPGKVQRDELVRDAREIALAAESLQTGGLRPHTELAVELGLHGQTLRLHGSFGDIFGGTRVVSAYGLFKAKRALDLWLRHLLLCAVDPTFERSVWVGRETGEKGKSSVVQKELRALPASEARGHLLDLVELYLEGQTRPLRFFPDASWEAMKTLSAPRRPTGEAALRRAVIQAASKKLGFPAGTIEPDIALAFGEDDPLGFSASSELPLSEVPFMALTERILAPLFASLKESKGD